jgi:TP901 family phage tail tape measure protein
MAATIGNLLIRIGADTKSLDRSLKDMERNLNKAGKNIQSIGGSLMKMAAPFAIAGAAGIKMAMDFETSMNKVVSLVGISREEVESMAPAVKKMAADMGISSKQAADALFFITSAGLRGKDAMDALEMSLKASASGLGEVEVIADLVTSAMNAYGSETLSASNATDVLVAAVREGKLEASELSAAMGSVLPIASNMGVSFDQVGAAMAAMSRTGTGAAEAATQLNGIMAALLKPTKEAEDTLSQYGLSAEELRRQMSEDGLLATLQTLKERFGDNTTAMASVFGNVRALKGVLDMMGASAEVNAEIFANLTDTTGMLDTAFDETAQTTQFKFNQTMERAKNVLLDLGETLLPLFNKIINLISKWVERLQKLDPAILENAVKIGLLIGGLGAVIKVVGMVISTFGTAIGIFTKAKAAVIAITTATKVFYAVLAANPIGLIVAAVTALILVVISAIRNFETWGAAVLAMMGPIGLVVNAIMSVKKNWDSVKTAFSTGGMIGGLKRLGIVLLDAILLPLQQILELASKLPGIGNMAAGALEKIENLRKRLDLTSSDSPTEQSSAPEAVASGGGTKAKPMSVDAILSSFEQVATESKNTTAKVKEDVEKKTAAILAFTNNVNSQIANAYKNHQEELEKSKEFTLGILEDQNKSSQKNIQEGVVSHLENMINKGHQIKSVFQEVAQTNDTVAESFQRMGYELSMAMEQGTVMEQVMATMGASVADAAMRGASSLQALASSAVESGAKVIRSLIMEGVAGYVRSAMTSIPFPFGAIAGAVAGGAAVGLFNSVLNKVKVPALATGGLAYGPTVAMVGDNPGANIDPEVISPLSKLKDIIGSTAQAIKVEWPQSGFRLDGRDLVLVMDRNQNIARRTR